MSDRKEDFRRQVETVWRLASTGFDTLREVVVRSSQSGRLRVDLALFTRERQQSLQVLGEQIAALLDENAIEVPDDVRRTYERVREIDQRIKADGIKVHDNAFGAPRGYEPEAGNFVDDSEPDEHAEIAEVKPKRRRTSKSRQER